MKLLLFVITETIICVERMTKLMYKQISSNTLKDEITYKYSLTKCVQTHD